MKDDLVSQEMINAAVNRPRGQEMINAAVNRPREEQRRAVDRKKPSTSS